VVVVLNSRNRKWPVNARSESQSQKAERLLCQLTGAGSMDSLAARSSLFFRPFRAPGCTCHPQGMWSAKCAIRAWRAFQPVGVRSEALQRS
jgi:hypothetical protein